MARQIQLHIGQVAYLNFLVSIAFSIQMIESSMSEKQEISRIA